jgi:hypothetical protein
MTVPTARATTALLTALSALGLLCTRLGVFDDGALMLGARLARMGKLPYLDFHTLYGPLGYTLLGELLGAAKNPGLALRLGQAVTPREAARTPFDSNFQRLYPRVLARFGNYEVRSRL